MEEPDLITRARQGCPRARGELVERHQGAVFAFLYRYTGRAADAEDLCQEVFLRAFRRLDGFRGQSRFGTWLIAIAANAARNWRRDERRRQAVEVRPLEDHEDPADCNPAANRENDEATEQIGAAVASLPARERISLVLRVYQQMSRDEIAAVMRCSPRAVGNLLFRARKRLADRLRRMPP